MGEINFVEPDDLEFVRTGERWPFTFWHRDDQTACARGHADDDYDPNERWWNCGDELADDGPQTWGYVSAQPDPQAVGFVSLKISGESSVSGATAAVDHG